MQTKTLIQSSANVIKITELVVGNTIKVVKTDYNNNPELYYGVVTDLINTGEKSYVQLSIYKRAYNRIESESVLYNGEKDIDIFPATPEEVKEFLSEAVVAMRKSFEDKERELVEEQRKVEAVEAFVSGEKAKELTTTSFTELTQEEFSQLKQGETDASN